MGVPSARARWLAVPAAAVLAGASLAAAVPGAEASGAPRTAPPVAGGIPILTVVPNLSGDTPDQARQQLSVAGLLLGPAGSRVDCNHLGLVSGQSPVAGATASFGAAVAVSLGVRPTPPAVCP